MLGEIIAKISGLLASFLPNLNPPPFHSTAATSPAALPAREATPTRHEVAMVLPDPSPLAAKAPAASKAPAPASLQA